MWKMQFKATLLIKPDQYADWYQYQYMWLCDYEKKRHGLNELFAASG